MANDDYIRNRLIPGDIPLGSPTMSVPPPQMQMTAPERVNPHDALTVPLSGVPAKIPAEVAAPGLPKKEDIAQGMAAIPNPAAGPLPRELMQNAPPSTRQWTANWRNAEEQRMADRLAQMQAPYSGNHPLMHKILHGLAMAGNIAGDVLAPGTMALIPGTQLHSQIEKGNLRAGIENIEKEKEKEAQEEAQTRHLNAQAADLENPVADEGKPIQTAAGLATYDPKTHMIVPITDAAGNPVLPYEKPSAPVETSQGLLRVNADGTAQKVTVDGNPVGPPLKTEVKQLEVGGRPHQVLINSVTGDHLRDLGETGEKPPVVNVNAGIKEDKQLRAAVLKSYQPAIDSAERFNVMAENYERAVKNDDQQAMLSLLYNHMGMTMGLQKGARMTQALIEEAQRSMPWLQGIKARFDKDSGILTGVVLSPQQMKRMVNLAQSRFSEDAVKSRSEARYLGAQDDGPDRIPNRATIRSYLAETNGNQEKAKELMGADGWTVK
jgi:hypothetical protein